MRIVVAALLSLAAACGGDDDGGGGGGSDAAASADAAASTDATAETTTVDLTTFLGDEQGSLVFVAVQDGDGAWQALTGDDGVYSFETTGRFTIATVCDDGDSSTIDLLSATTDDFTSITRGCGAGADDRTATMAITVNGLGAGESAQVISQSSSYGLTMDDSTSDVSVPPGTWSVGVTRRNSSYVVDKLVLRRAVTFTDGATTNVLVNTDTQGLVPQEHNFLVTGGLEGDEIGFSAYMYTERNMVFLLGDQIATAGTYAAPPAAGIAATDYFRFGAAGTLLGAQTDVRQVVNYSAGAADDVALALPASFSPFECLTGSASPYPRPQLEFDRQEGATLYGFKLYGDHEILWNVSPAWVGASEHVTLLTPDFSGLAGWDDVWVPEVGVEISCLGYTNAFDAGTSFTDTLTRYPERLSSVGAQVGSTGASLYGPYTP